MESLCFGVLSIVAFTYCRVCEMNKKSDLMGFQQGGTSNEESIFASSDRRRTVHEIFQMFRHFLIAERRRVLRTPPHFCLSKVSATSMGVRKFGKFLIFRVSGASRRAFHKFIF